MCMCVCMCVCVCACVCVCMSVCVCVCIRCSKSMISVACIEAFKHALQGRCSIDVCKERY